MDTKDAKKLISLARESIETEFENKEPFVEEEIKTKFSKPQGVFTTLNTYKDHQLRGCIGFVEARYPLWLGVIYTARLAAFKDPRFEPLKKEELDNIVIELSILSTPKRIIPDPKYICIGKDGLIVKYGKISGLLLPQVATEYNMNWETFLQHTCLKAGLPRDCYKNPQVEVYSFSAEVYKELSPGGDVVKEESFSCGT
ncbi:MAG: TIGR00296 family protein [Hydrogenobaculum sp.]